MADVLESVAQLRAAAGDQLVARRLLRVGTVNAGTGALVLPAVRAFGDQHSGSTVEIRTLQKDEIQVSLVEGTLDIGIVNLLEGDDVPSELELIPLVTGRPVAVIPASHPLADRVEATADELRAERFVAMRAGYLMHRFAHRLFGAELPPEWHSADGAEMGKMMVAEGIGIAVLPSYSVYGDPLERAGLLVARPIKGDQTTVTMVALRRRQTRLTQIVRDMIQHLREHADPSPISGLGVAGSRLACRQRQSASWRVPFPRRRAGRRCGGRCCCPGDSGRCRKRAARWSRAGRRSSLGGCPRAAPRW